MKSLVLILLLIFSGGCGEVGECPIVCFVQGDEGEGLEAECRDE